MDDLATIPLEDEDSPARVLIPQTIEPKVRLHRTSTRHACDNVMVGFSPQLKSGRTDHAECTVTDISPEGMALEYDAPMDRGTLARITYRTISHRKVSIQCRVMVVTPVGEDRFVIGVKFTRRLRREEVRAARHRAGQDVAPGLRLRKLKPAAEAVPATVLDGLAVAES